MRIIPVPLAIRQNVAAIADYTPGQSSDDRECAQLSSNENPFSPLPSVRTALADAAQLINRYPDNDANELTLALSRFYDISPGSIALGCGSIGLLRNILIAMVDPDDEVIFGEVSFEAYPILCQQIGAKCVTVPLVGQALDLAGFSAHITTRTKVILVCNPNNPTGTSISKKELDALLDKVPPHIMVVIDEAYFEYVRNPDSPDGRIYALERPNVVTLRSMSKAFGLAALRVGYAIGQPDTIRLLKRAQLPFDINALAQKAAIVSIENYHELVERVEEANAMRSRMQQRMDELGLATLGSQTNFFWFPLRDKSGCLFDFLRTKKIIARLRKPHGVRVSIGTASENERFMQAIETFAAQTLGVQ